METTSGSSPNFENSGVLILGTDTEVGKTYQAARLISSLAGRGVCVGAYKPVASGIVAGQPSDPQLLHSATGRDWPLDRVCPQQFSAPVAPPIAASMEEKLVDDDLLADGASWWDGKCEFLVVESAGGALSPISQQSTVLDVASAIGLPTIVVAANRLGVVSHTLLTLEAVVHRKLRVAGVVLNTLTADSNESQVDISQDTNYELLRSFVDPHIPIVADIVELVEFL